MLSSTACAPANICCRLHVGSCCLACILVVCLCIAYAHETSMLTSHSYFPPKHCNASAHLSMSLIAPHKCSCTSLSLETDGGLRYLNHFQPEATQAKEGSKHLRPADQLYSHLLLRGWPAANIKAPEQFKGSCLRVFEGLASQTHARDKAALFKVLEVDISD